MLKGPPEVYQVSMSVRPHFKYMGASFRVISRRSSGPSVVMAYIAPEDSAFGISFLERLEADAKPLNIIQAPNLSEVLNSVRNNISNILNTRVGDSQSSPQLGLIDFNDATFGED